MEGVPQVVDPLRKGAVGLISPEDDEVQQQRLLRIRATDGLRRPDPLERVDDASA